MIDAAFKAKVSRLLSMVGIDSRFGLTQLKGGANNRVFRVDIDGKPYLLKSYFRHAEDPRDRLATEFYFMRFAWENGIRCIPQPVACDKDNGIALYDFIEGGHPKESQITKKEVSQAAHFYQELNRFKRLDSARNLPIASEACFSVSQHLGCVARRLAKLETVEKSSATNEETLKFIFGDLSEAWKTTVHSAAVASAAIGVPLDREIGLDDRCLSPSDFGFHNVLLASDGSLHFIDFEYAGWDDPAKMVCDFFCQPAVPVPARYYDMFVDSATSGLSEPEMHRRRISLLLPAYVIKWCCILLNDFLPIGRQRRDFALEKTGEEHKRKQLQKARLMLKAIRS